MDQPEWIAACAHQLQRRWRTVDPEVLEEVAADLWTNEEFRSLPPIAAAQEWLAPVALPVPSSKNGVLAMIPGDVIGRTSQGLPAPTDAQPEKIDAVVEVGSLGRVRITFERMRGPASRQRWA